MEKMPCEKEREGERKRERADMRSEKKRGQVTCVRG